ncbi:MAG: T9SS type A sorting domain-containing protein [Bacteroidales bacterium]
MKKNFYTQSLGRSFLAVMIFFVMTLGASAQWKIYDSTVLPNENDPVFGTSGNAGAGLVSTMVADPDNSNNSFLELLTIANADNGTWRRVFAETVSDITIVMKVKAANSDGRRVLELDVDNGGWRERLYINQEDNKLRLQHGEGYGADNEFSLPNDGDVAQWNIYRLTKDNTGLVKLYINEDPTPLAQAQSTQASSTNNHFRFGDTNGSHNISALIDWVIWDVTGTYAPGEGTPIPDYLLPQEPQAHNWRMYDASVLPNLHIPTFDESNVGGAGATNTILNDPDNPDNNFLELVTVQNGDNFMWRTMLQPDKTAITMVMRVKAANDESRRVVELDLHHNGIRERMYINREANRVRLNEAIGGGDGGEIEAPEGVSLSDWNIYRLTMENGLVNLYLNEDPTPIASGTSATSTTQQYFRFGDGNGSHNAGAIIDWILWDETGAFAPGQGSPIPNPVVTPNGDATLAELLVDGVLVQGFDPAVTFYDIVLDAGTTDIPQIAAEVNFEGATLEITQASELPGAATVEVTAFNGFTTLTYSVNFRFPSSNADLAEIILGETPLADFDPDVLVYDVELPKGTTEAPEVSAVAADEFAVVVVSQADVLPGQATIVVTAEDGTEKTYAINFTVDATHVPITESLQVKLYPNPSTSVLHIEMPDLAGKALVTVYNTAGQLVMTLQMENTLEQINISQLKEGLYIIRIQADHNQLISTFIKQ